MKSIRLVAVSTALALAGCSADHVEANEPSQTSTSSTTAAPMPPSATQSAAPPPVESAPATPSAAPSASGSASVVPGGFMTRDVADKEITAEAAQAIMLLKADRKDPKISLTAIKSAATQVVAGINYKLELEIKTGSGDKTVTVVMTKEPGGKRKLSDVKGF